MNHADYADPAEHHPLLRFFYRGWRPTRAGRWANRFARWLTVLGLTTPSTAVLEVRGRTSGRPRATPVVVATVGNARYLVSILGAESEWVRNVEAAHGDAVLRQNGRRPIHLVAVPPAERAQILREYVRVATSGREHLPVQVGAPLSEFEAIADRYPVYRIDPAEE